MIYISLVVNNYSEVISVEAKIRERSKSVDHIANFNQLPWHQYGYMFKPIFTKYTSSFKSRSSDSLHECSTGYFGTIGKGLHLAEYYKHTSMDKRTSDGLCRDIEPYE